jgi:HD-GYP domain-containing protein (c-di-GMP phosphodiesterase class II)
MTSDRTYRRALPEHVALDELRACAGTQFDPRVVRALLTIVELSASEPALSPALAQTG